MRLLTIGAFARATRLSAKALRLYDDLGLLAPAAVDRESGYRYYTPGQFDRARLIAWLRRLGMPLVRIRDVVDLPGPQAAIAVRQYWDEVRAQTVSREQLAGFLIERLSGGGGGTGATLRIRYAAGTDTGRVRTSNEDAAYADEHLLAVADGIAGLAGAQASAAAIDALRPLPADVPAGDLFNLLAEAAEEARRAVGEVAAGSTGGEAGTTLTAMLWSGSQLGLVHIGDTRAYRLRDGQLAQITHDHTWVQSLVDSGELSAAEAESHPQRSLLAKAMTGGADVPDLSVHEATVGDRYLLCSDGLSQVLGVEELRRALAEASGPRSAVSALIELAHHAGAPDNIACAVADVVSG